MSIISPLRRLIAQIILLLCFGTVTSAWAEQLQVPTNTQSSFSTEWFNLRLSADYLSGANGGGYIAPEINWTPKLISNPSYSVMPRLGLLTIKSENAVNHAGIITGVILQANVDEKFFLDAGLAVFKFTGYAGELSLSAGVGRHISRTGLIRDLQIDFANVDVGSDPTLVVSIGITIGF